MSEATAQPTPSRTRLLHRLALLQAILLLTAVVVAMPIVFRSMGLQLTEGQARTFYEFPSGQAVTAASTAAVADTESFFNIAAIDLDEAAGSITLAVSGHRNCDGSCTPLAITLSSLDDNADVRRALPPSVTLELPGTKPLLNETIQLPVRGQPGQYPFDDYLLWLGLSGTISASGTPVPITPALLDGKAEFTTQNQLRDYLMDPPIDIPPSRVQAVTDPFSFVGVQELHFERPIHQQILAVLLITLIAVSAIMAVAMRDVTDLIVGVGSLVLGIWGVRSVLVPQPIPVVTSIDLALSVVILFVLLGLSLRAAQHFQRTSELPELRFRRRGRGGRE